MSNHDDDEDEVERDNLFDRRNGRARARTIVLTDEERRINHIRSQERYAEKKRREKEYDRKQKTLILNNLSSGINNMSTSLSAFQLSMLDSNEKIINALIKLSDRIGKFLFIFHIQLIRYDFER